MHGKAKESARIDLEKELIETSTIQALGKNKYGNITQSELQEILNNNIESSKTEVIENGDTIVVKFIDSNRYYEIYNNGNVSNPVEIIEDEYAGDITKNGQYDGSSFERAYKINCIEDLVAFSQDVSLGNNYKGQYIVLTRTLDFSSIFSFVDYTTTIYDKYLGGDGTTGLKEQLAKNGFIPIGDNGKYFAGIFDGNNYEIKNIYEKTTNYAGLFGGIKEAIIKNISISGNIMTSTEYAGGIIGVCGNQSNKIINCHNYANITAQSCSGGIIGKTHYGTQLIYNCSNKGGINGEYCGGIVGQSYGAAGIIKIFNCCNYGELEGMYSGGILGAALDGSATPSYINNCYNTGNVKGDVYGAILGKVYNVKEIQNCYYLDNVDIATGVNISYADKIECLSESYMTSEAFLNALNTYIEEYNNKNTTDSDFIRLSKWILKNNGNYPILKINEN